MYRHILKVSYICCASGMALTMINEKLKTEYAEGSVFLIIAVDYLAHNRLQIY